MAEITISGLPNGVLPLSGTEAVPVDQNGITVQVPASSLAGGGQSGGVYTVTSSGNVTGQATDRFVYYHQTVPTAADYILPAANTTFGPITLVDAGRSSQDFPITAKDNGGTTIGFLAGPPGCASQFGSNGENWYQILFS